MGSSILLCSCCQMEWKLFTSCFLWVSSCLWITGTVSIKKNTKRNSYQMQAGFHFFVKQKFLKLHRSTYFIWTRFYSCPVHIWSSLKTNPTKPLAVNHIAEEKQVKTLICRRCSFAHCRNPSFVLSRTLWLSKLGCFGFLLGATPVSRMSTGGSIKCTSHTSTDQRRSTRKSNLLYDHQSFLADFIFFQGITEDT